MEIKRRFDHFNINVTDLERSLDFYDRALGLNYLNGLWEAIGKNDKKTPRKK